MENTHIRFIEIPVLNLPRAMRFYQTIFKFTFETMNFGNAELALFNIGKGKTNGALVAGLGYIPSQQGSLVYFSPDEDLQAVIERISQAGGSITMEKSSLGQHGFSARFIDTEGNKMALHSET